MSAIGGQKEAALRTSEERYDIVVCGGGLAGFCAAVAAARHGAQVCLVQDRPVFGGNSSSEIRVPPQGAASFHAYARETGIISELLIEERACNHESPTFDNGWINSVWDMVLYDMAMSTPNLTFRLNTTITDVRMRDEKTVQAVIGRVSHAETELTLLADTFIDCTGDGVVAALAGCEWRMGTEGRWEFGEPHAPEEASAAVMGNSIHFKAKDTGRPVPFTAPDWAVRYDNPDFFYKQGRWPADPRSGFWWIELSVPWHTIYDNERLRHELTRHVLGVWDWIKNRDPRLKEEASTYALDWIGQVPGKRESRRIIGDYFMTEHDPLRKTVFDDEVAYGGWFIDLHEPGGLLASFSEKAAVEGNQATGSGSYMAKSYVGPYGIPLRILIAKGMSNLMMAGRNVSVTHAALGTVRVMGTTALMGQAAGTAAAIAVRAGIPVRDVPERAIRDVQQALLRDGCFLPNAANEDPRDLARSAAVRASSEALLAGCEPAGPAAAGTAAGEPGRPVAEAEQPAVGPERPAAEAEQPEAGPERLVAEAEQPDAGPERPAAGMEQPEACPERLVAEAEQPEAGPVRLASEAEQPAAVAERPIAEPLAQRRGQWIAVGADRIERLAVCLDNDADTPQQVEARLYAVEHLWDYRVEPGKPLASAVLEVRTGIGCWEEWHAGVDVSALRGSYVRLDLLANPNVRWHAAAAIEPGHVSAYELGNGLMRRFGQGVTMNFRIEPAQACYSAASVLNGVTRPYRSPGLWRSDPALPLPQWLELAWEKPVRIGRVELTFPGQLLRDYRSYPALYRDPQCPKDITMEAWVDGRWTEAGMLGGNYQRRRTIVLERPVCTDLLRITVLATNGDPSAAIYEVRCYED